MADLTVMGKCARCAGTGTDNPPEGGGDPGACLKCGGSGHLEVGKIDITDAVNLLNDILEKCEDILDKLPE